MGGNELEKVNSSNFSNFTIIFTRFLRVVFVFFFFFVFFFRTNSKSSTFIVGKRKKKERRKKQEVRKCEDVDTGVKKHEAILG